MIFPLHLDLLVQGMERSLEYSSCSSYWSCLKLRGQLNKMRRGSKEQFILFYGGMWNVHNYFWVQFGTDFHRKCSIASFLHASNIDWYCSTLPLHLGKRQPEDLCFKLICSQYCGTSKKRLSQNIFDQFESNFADIITEKIAFEITKI